MASVRDLILNVIEKKEGNALTAAANDIEKLGRGVDVTGDSMKGFTKDAEKLNAEIEKSTARVKDLHKQFAATGDVSLFGDIRKEESRLRSLEKTFKALTPDFAKAGVQLGETLGVSVTNSFSSQITGAFSGGGPIGAAVIGGVVLGLGTAIAAPLGAAIAGAVAGTVGTGGIIGGVLAASKDPVVRSAFTEFADDIERQFFAAGTSFVEPVRNSLAVLDQAFGDLHLDDTFAKAAPDLQIIAQGLGDLAKNIMPGLNQALARSGPFANAAAHGFAYLGTSTSEFLDQVTRSHGAVEGLEATFIVLGDTVKFIGLNLHAASIAFHLFNSTLGGFFNVADKTLDIIGLHSDKVHNLNEEFHELTTRGDGAAQAIDGLGDPLAGAADRAEALAKAIRDISDAEDNYINQQLAMSNATLAVAKDFTGLNDELVKGKGNWDLNTEAGNKNLTTINQVIGDLERQRDQAVKTGAGTASAILAADRAYDDQLEKLLAVAQAAGATKAQLELLAKTYYISIRADVTLTNQINKANAVDRALSNLIGFASGGTVPGPVGAPRLAIVHGQERVLTPPQAAAMDRAPSGSDGAAMQLIFGGNTDSALATVIMKLIRSGDITILSKAIV